RIGANRVVLSRAVIELGNWGDRNLPHALLLVHCRSGMLIAISGHAIQMNALVSTVPACGVTQRTADALFFLDVSDDLVIQVEVLPFLHAWQGHTTKILNARES